MTTETNKTDNNTEAALYIEVGKIIDEAGFSLPNLERDQHMHYRFLELSTRYGVHKVRSALANSVEYGPLDTAWDRHELRLAKYALVELAHQPIIVEKENTKDNLLHRHLEGEEEGSIIFVSEETVYSYMGVFSMKNVTHEPGWYWWTWEEGGGPCSSKKEAIEAVKESIKSFAEYAERTLREWMNSY